MQIDIQARNFSLTKALVGHIKRRLSFALSSHDEHIQRVQVRLSDINGPRGGADKCCHIQVMLTRFATVVVKDTETNLYTAISRAASRTSRTVGRQLKKKRISKRTSSLRSLLPIAE